MNQKLIKAQCFFCNSTCKHVNCKLDSRHRVLFNVFYLTIYELFQLTLGVSWCSSKSEECKPLIDLLKEVPLKIVSCSESKQLARSVRAAEQQLPYGDYT